MKLAELLEKARTAKGDANEDWFDETMVYSSLTDDRTAARFVAACTPQAVIALIKSHDRLKEALQRISSCEVCDYAEAKLCGCMTCEANNALRECPE